MNQKTVDQLVEKWLYRLAAASNNGGASISEPEAEELWYVLKALGGQNAKPG